MYIDYSLWRPTMTFLHGMGVKGVGRYIGWDSVPGYASMGKNISKPEADELLADDFEIFLFFEYGANAAAGGAAQGAKDGVLASEQLAELGLPHDMGVYFAMDWDVPDYAPNSTDPLKKLGPVAEYFQEIHRHDPAYKVGGYGGYYPISRLLTAGLIQLACQTIAWSGAAVDKRIDLLQNGFGLAGGQADVDQLSPGVADFGQAPRPTAPPRKTKIVLHKDVTSGQRSLAGLAHAYLHNEVSTILRLTAEHSPGGQFTDLMADYIDVGHWTNNLPAGQDVWFYEEVAA